MPHPRFLKTKDERINDTLDYIDSKLSVINAAEVTTAVKALTTHKQNALSSLISLGATGTKTDRNNNREPRRAKRALLLISSVFIDDTVNGKKAELDRIKALPEATDADILLEIKSWFTVIGVTKEDVADNAVANIDKLPNWNNVNIDRYNAVRTKYSKNHSFNCYNAVVFWAFQAGAISRRFLWNKLGDDDGNHFFPTFSKCGWTTEAEYKENSSKGIDLIRDSSKTTGGEFIIPKGITVYFVNSYKLFGHIALSLGDGTVISQNSVIPADKSKIRSNERAAVSQMERAETHIIGIRHLMDIHFYPNNGYFKMQTSNSGFWEAYPLNER